MATYAKDSMIIIIRAGEDGYFTEYRVYNVSPPPIPRMQDSLSDVPSDLEREREDRISADKAALKTEINAAIDTRLDV